MAPHIGIGLMSGTSVDAVDAALVEIDASRSQPIRLLNYLEVPIPLPLQQRLRDVMRPDARTTSAAEICQLNVEVGQLFRDAAEQVAGSALPAVEWIGSHGQTVAHVPCSDEARGWRTPSTLQIGEPSEIAQALGVTVVADFRPRDVACGGGGAPLMPAAEAVLFRHVLRGEGGGSRGGEGGAEAALVLQNVGGMGSLTALSASGDVLASFDTGPGNMVMDLIVQGSRAATGFAAAVVDSKTRTDDAEDRPSERGGRSVGHSPPPPPPQYDVDGRLAAAGRVIHQALDWARSHPFFATPPPRSGGKDQRRTLPDSPSPRQASYERATFVSCQVNES